MIFPQDPSKCFLLLTSFTSYFLACIYFAQASKSCELKRRSCAWCRTAWRAHLEVYITFASPQTVSFGQSRKSSGLDILTWLPAQFKSTMHVPHFLSDTVNEVVFCLIYWGYGHSSGCFCERLWRRNIARYKDSKNAFLVL